VEPPRSCRVKPFAASARPATYRPRAAPHTAEPALAGRAPFATVSRSRVSRHSESAPHGPLTGGQGSLPQQSHQVARGPDWAR